MRILLFLFLPILTFADDGFLVPKEIYHGGRPDILLKNVRANTVPAEDWDRFILKPEPSVKDLSRHRQGLYGYKSAMPAFVYGPWIVKVKIKDECRRAPHVAFDPEGYPFWRLEKNPGFQAWVEKLDVKIRKRCTRPAPNGQTRWLQGEIPGRHHPSLAICQKVMADYLDAQKFWIVQDDYAQDAWYIRRRECIEGIDGTREDLTSWLSNDAFFDFRHPLKPLPIYYDYWENPGASDLSPLTQNLLAHLDKSLCLIKNETDFENPAQHEQLQTLAAVVSRQQQELKTQAPFNRYFHTRRGFECLMWIRRALKK